MIDPAVSAGLRDAIARARRPALIAGLAGMIACAAGYFLAPAAFFPSYLFACMFCLGLALGCQAVLMLNHVTGGAWGIPIRRSLEAGTRTLPVVAALFLPLLPGLRSLYEWARPEDVAHDAILRHKQLYLNTGFFLARTVICFAAWMAFAFFLNRWSREQDERPTRGLSRRLQLLSSAGLVVYGLTITFFSIDWVMSLEPHWYSTMYGVLFIAGQALSGFAFVIALTVVLARYPPLSGFINRKHFHDLGKLMLAFVMFWAYVSFSQYLIIWAGNLPEEIPWYLRRLQGGWGWFGMALILFHFVLPFLLLLPATANRNPRILSSVALLVVFMRFVDVFWLVRPAATPGHFTLRWMDVAAPVGILGIWLFVFLGQLLRRPILPVNDPEFAAALEHGADGAH
ncbi:MAG: hypothetical protein LC796_06800 [Acidobacteria bacterium]|nr:hypothetical protein [Acidobacteriota bacterium]MCA1609818.1 hypothetical protein [Acidobacteriota bacterium]